MMFDNGDTLIPAKKKKKSTAETIMSSATQYFSKSGTDGLFGYISEIMSGSNKPRVSRTKMTSI
jgi:hypothetical protein